MLKPLLAATLSVAVTLGSFGTAQAGPFGPGAPLAGDARFVDVQYRGERRARRAARRAYRQELRRQDRRREARRDYRRTERRLRRQRNRALAGGVIGGLALGAIIAGSQRSYAAPRYAAPRYVAPRATYRFSPAHHGWCSTRYRSYRSSDGTFQPYHGPRKACISPYL